MHSRPTTSRLLPSSSIRSKFLACLMMPIAALLMAQTGWGQTLYDSFSDGNFTASPVWGGNTSNWTVETNSDAAAGATGSNTLRLNSTAVAQTVYLSSQISSWGTSQEWGVWIGRRAQAFTAANQAYFWLVANESDLTSATVDGYRLAIGDDSGGDEIRLEYVVNGAVSATVITSSESITNGLTDIGFLVRVTRSSSGDWALFTSTLPTSNGTGAISTDIPNATNASVSQGTGTNNSLIPAANNYIGVAALHSTGANAIVTAEFDQIYFTLPTTAPTVTTTPATSITVNSATAGGNITATGGANATERGVEYSTTDGFANGTGTEVAESGDFGTGTFTRPLTGLSAGTTYYFKAFATNSFGTSYGAQESFLTLPAAPATPSASAVGPVGFTVDWGVVASATSYRLDVSTASDFSSFVSGYEDLTVAGTSQAVTGLTPATTYYARVRAVNASGTGASSDTLTQATDAATSPIITVTGFPSALTTTVGTPSASTAVSVSGLSLTDDITATAPSADFEVSADDANWSSSATFAEESGSASGTLYIRISAAAAVGSPSGDVELSSTGATPQNVTVTGTVFKAEPPNHATGFAAGTMTTTNIPATWTAASPEPDGYLLVVSSSSVTDPVDGTDPGDDTDVSDGSAQVKITPGSATFYDGFTGFAAGTTYTFALYPYNNSGTAINFKTASASSFSALLLPAAPATPTFASVTDSGFTVNWAAVTGADDYRLDVATDSGFTSFVSGYEDLTVTGLSQAVTGLEANTTYHARVRAVNDTGTSANSPTASQTTSNLPAPVATAATDVGANDFTANWNAVAGATGYEVEWRSLFTTNDDFSDGNFTASPAWSGDTGSFAVLTDSTLPSGTAATDGFFLASNASVGNATLTTPSTETSEWRFSWGSPSFEPSGSNFFGVILMSSEAVTGDPTATASWNGYYLKIGVNSSPDPVELWRRTGTTSTKVGDFPTSPDFASAALTAGINVRVTRSAAGVFELFTETGFTYAATPTTSRGTLTDTTHATSSHFGVFTRFANPATTRRVYLDNLVLPNSTISTPLATYTVGNVTSYAVTGASTSTDYSYVVRATSTNSTSADSNEITVTTTAGNTSPVLTAAVDATVDAPFAVTFTDDETWRSAITGITVDGTPLTAGFGVSAGAITFTPAGSDPAELLQTPGTKAIVITATGYADATVSQEIGVGAATQLVVTTQPTAPAANGDALAIQPVVVIRDQYGNLTTSTAPVTAAVGAGTWTLGGTATVNAVSGSATFAGLTATASSAVTGATIDFTSPGLTGVTSAAFNIPAPDFIDLIADPVTEDFDGMETTLNLPFGWRMAASTSSPSWTTAATTVTREASSGTPTAGGTYNWGSDTDRAVGAMTSSSFASPNNLLVKIRNNSGGTIDALSISYQAERYRVNTAAASVELFYSLNGTTWTAITAGDIATSEFPTGSSAYDFANPLTITRSGIAQTGLGLADGAIIYFRWNINTTGASSQGIGIDDISIVIPSAPTVATGTAGSITRTTAEISGNDVSSDGGAAITERGVVVSTSPEPTVADTKVIASGTTGLFDSTLTGLADNTTYYIRAFATNGVGTAYGSEVSFDTVANSLPTFDGMSVSTLKGSPVDILLSKILSKSSDADGDTITVSAVTSPTSEGGTASLGATAITYTPAVDFDGTDTLTFTLSDGFGTIDHTITITVSDDPLFTSPGNAPSITTLPGGEIRIAFNGIPGRTYGIQRSEDMAPGSWVQIAAVTAAENSTASFDDEEPPSPAAFYRIAYPAEE